MSRGKIWREFEHVHWRDWCYRGLAGKKCHKGDKCRYMHGSGDPCIFSHIPYVSRHTDENGVDWLAVRIPLPQAMDRFCVKMGVDIKTLDSGYPLKLGGEDCIMFSVNDFKPPDEEAAASAKNGSWIPGEDNDTWWYKHHRKKTDNVFYGHGADIPGALEIASALSNIAGTRCQGTGRQKMTAGVTNVTRPIRCRRCRRHNV
jgi:hypothetical protein